MQKRHFFFLKMNYRSGDISVIVNSNNFFKLVEWNIYLVNIVDVDNLTL